MRSHRVDRSAGRVISMGGSAINLDRPPPGEQAFIEVVDPTRVACDHGEQVDLPPSGGPLDETDNTQRQPWVLASASPPYSSFQYNSGLNVLPAGSQTHLPNDAWVREADVVQPPCPLSVCASVRAPPVLHPLEVYRSCCCFNVWIHLPLEMEMGAIMSIT